MPLRSLEAPSLCFWITHCALRKKHQQSNRQDRAISSETTLRGFPPGQMTTSVPLRYFSFPTKQNDKVANVLLFVGGCQILSFPLARSHAAKCSSVPMSTNETAATHPVFGFQRASVMPSSEKQPFFFRKIMSALTFYQINFFFSSIFTIFSPLGSIKISSFVIPLITSMTKV